MASAAALSSSATTPPTQLTPSLKFYNIKRLSNDGSYYLCWKSQVLMIFAYYDLTEIIDGTLSAPSDPDELKTWKKLNTQTKVHLMMLCEQPLPQPIANEPTAPLAWTYLHDRFDRRNTTTLFHSVNSFFSNSKKADDTTMLDHINQYDTNLRRILDRLNKTDDNAKYFEDDTIRAYHLLMTLPNSMENIIDNL